MAHSHKGIEMYQPIPFEKYQGKGHVRGDCNLRWATIKQYLPSNLSDITFFDYGCAEGFFMFMALKEGAKKCVFIDQDYNCLKTAMDIAEDQGFTDKCEFKQELNWAYADIGFYLDVHYNGKTPSLSEFSERCGTLFVSPSGSGNTNSPKLESELKKIFKSVTPIYTGYESRTIYKCTNHKENE